MSMSELHVCILTPVLINDSFNLVVERWYSSTTQVVGQVVINASQRRPENLKTIHCHVYMYVRVCSAIG
jgi:hypothetical protein